MRRTIVIAAAALTVATSCTDRPPDLGGTRVTAAAVKAVALETFDDCRRLQSYLRSEAGKIAEQLTDPHANFSDTAIATFAAAPQAAQRGAERASADSAGTSSAARAPAGGFSTTNVQEAGVDEPDTVKTDGRTLFAAVGDKIRAVAIDGATPRLLDTYRIENMYDAQLLLAGERLLVISSGHGGPILLEDTARISRPVTPGKAGAPMWRGNTEVIVLDVSDPSAIRLRETVALEGSIVSARLIDGVARIVLRTSGAAVEIAYPERPGIAARRTAERKNRKALAGLDVEDWLPRFTVGGATTPSGGATAPSGGDEVAPEPIVPCERVHRPPTFSGLEMVSVFSLDPANPRPSEAATVVGTGETVYASPSSLYVATNDWAQMRAMEMGRIAPGAGISTTIHRFDISDPKRPRYRSSGSVPGQILNQWSLSEHEGVLRVATTLQPAFTGGPEGAPSESHVTVLRPRGKLLARIGRVTGLGRTERIYGVRFIGDLGYVVTFRQVDPLYVIDLSTPARPRVRGELKISGYSAYLHPVGDGRLLGVGADADEQGARLGTQATVFDVSDPDAPSAVDRERFRNAYTPLEGDHHAFTWWEPARLALFPLSSHHADGSGGSSGAVALKISPAGEIEVAGMLQHPSDAVGGSDQPEFAGPVEISRVVVAGERIFTLSYRGLGVAALATLEDDGFLSWPA